ncbi:CCR4-NOT transcription complex subunit 6-like [Taenia solium]|eukprot:TsM_000387600 transcript=TsM_000387600 gene=TsM_000387600
MGHLDNHLGELPAANLHRVKKLRNLQLKNNRLRCLPYVVSQFWRLGTLSLSENPWMGPFPPMDRDGGPKSLFHFASAVLPALESQLPRNVESRLEVLRRCFRCHRICGVEADWYVGYIELEYTERIYSFTPAGRSEVNPVCIRRCCSPYCGIRVRVFEHFI